MEVWGPEAFDNVVARDTVEGGSLTASAAHTLDHLDNFLGTEANGGDPTTIGEVEPAYAACEIIAAARGGRVYWTTSKERSLEQPFFPREVDAFLKTEPVFSDEDARRAIEVVGILHAKAERENWPEVAARRRALETTLERLLNPFVPWVPRPIVRERLSSLAELA